jgi:hypothetical protein
MSKIPVLCSTESTLKFIRRDELNKFLALVVLATAISTPAFAAGHASPNSIIAPLPRAMGTLVPMSVMNAGTQPRTNSIIAPLPR